MSSRQYTFRADLCSHTLWLVLVHNVLPTSCTSMSLPVNCALLHDMIFRLQRPNPMDTTLFLFKALYVKQTPLHQAFLYFVQLQISSQIWIIYAITPFCVTAKDLSQISICVCVREHILRERRGGGGGGGAAGWREGRREGERMEDFDLTYFELYCFDSWNTYGKDSTP